MIAKIDIEHFLREKFTETDYFLVEVSVDAANNIAILFDKPLGINILDCKQVNTWMEQQFDRDREDYALQVSSPGLSNPFKVIEQYQKNIGRSILLKTKEEKLEGKLLEVGKDGVKIEVVEIVREAKKKIKQQKEKAVPFDQIMEAKSVILFKKFST